MISSGILALSYTISGLLMDKFGRKKIILIKIWLTVLLLIPLIIMGFVSVSKTNIVVIIMFFAILLFASFTFDIALLGFESVTKD